LLNIEKIKEIVLDDTKLLVASKLAEQLDIKLFIVGGFVRDILINRDTDEIDFLIVGDGIEFANVFANELGVEKVNVYKTFGTAQFNMDEYKYEFVGARKESYSKDSRNPQIDSGSFIDDISRRDFTINSLAISLNNENYGELIDTFDGLSDLENEVIKTPLDPCVTFEDDPLRIMRAIRFASQLNFIIDDSLLKAISEKAERLKIITQERITDEFLKIMNSPKPSVGLKLMQFTGVMKYVFPEISVMGGIEQRDDHHHKDVFLHTCQVVDNVAQVSDNLWLRFSALVHDIAKPATKKFIEGTGWSFHGHDEIGARWMKKIFSRMKLPLHHLDYVRKMIRLHLRPIALVNEEVTDSAIRRLIVAADEDLDDLITLCRADITSKNPAKVNKYLSNYEKVMEKVKDVRERDELRAFQSPVRGDEIMKICNIKPSRKVGEIKTAIEEAILEGQIRNTYDEAFAYLLKIKDKFLESNNI
jgi:poly(A) polymerase